MRIIVLKRIGLGIIDLKNTIFFSCADKIQKDYTFLIFLNEFAVVLIIQYFIYLFAKIFVIKDKEKLYRFFDFSFVYICDMIINEHLEFFTHCTATYCGFL